MLKAVIFDFDGVIVDSEPIHYGAFMQVLGRLGFELDYPTYLVDYVGFDDRDFFREALRVLREAGRPTDHVDMDQLLRDKAQAVQTLVQRGVAPTPGVMALIESCAAEFPLAVASGALRDEIERITTVLGVRSRFQVIVAADDVERSKPDPQTYERAVRQLADKHPALDLQPGDCLAIEDTPAGIASAKSAGLMTLAVNTTVAPAMLGEADRIINDFQQMSPARLRQWFDGRTTTAAQEANDG